MVTEDEGAEHIFNTGLPRVFSRSVFRRERMHIERDSTKKHGIIPVIDLSRRLSGWADGLGV